MNKAFEKYVQLNTNKSESNMELTKLDSICERIFNNLLCESQTLSKYNNYKNLEYKIVNNQYNLRTVHRIGRLDNFLSRGFYHPNNTISEVDNNNVYCSCNINELKVIALPKVEIDKIVGRKKAGRGFALNDKRTNNRAKALLTIDNPITPRTKLLEEIYTVEITSSLDSAVVSYNNITYLTTKNKGWGKDTIILERIDCF